MPPPQAIVCKICGGKFMKSSYPIHVPRCQKKFDASHTKCENCGRQINNCDWGQHRMDCKPIKRRPKPKKKVRRKDAVDLVIDGHQCDECETNGAELSCAECEMVYCSACSKRVHNKGSRARHTLKNATGQDPSKERDVVETADGDIVEREACRICNRKFAVDRIYIHERICIKKQESAKKIKPKIGSKLRVQGTDFERYAKKRPKTPPEVLEWRKNGRRWRQEREEFKSVVESQNMLVGIQPSEEKLPTSIVEPPKNIILPKKNVDISKRMLLHSTPDASHIAAQIKQATSEFRSPPSTDNTTASTPVSQTEPSSVTVTAPPSSKAPRNKVASQHRRSNIKEAAAPPATVNTLVSVRKTSGSQQQQWRPQERIIKGADGSRKVRSQYQDRALARKRGEEALKRMKQSKKKEAKPKKSTHSTFNRKLGGAKVVAANPQDVIAARASFVERQEKAAARASQAKLTTTESSESPSLVEAPSNRVVLPSKKLSSMQEYLERERLRRKSSQKNMVVRKSRQQRDDVQHKLKKQATAAQQKPTLAPEVDNVTSTSSGATAFTVGSDAPPSKAMPMLSSTFRPKKKPPKAPLPGLLGRKKREPQSIAERDNPNVGKVPIQRMLKAKLVDGSVQRVLSHETAEATKDYDDSDRRQRVREARQRALFNGS